MRLFTPFIRKLQEAIQKTSALDLRSLALCRIAVGLIMLGDLVIRSLDLTALYTDEGVLPVALLRSDFLTDWDFCFHAWFGSAEWIQFLLIVHTIAVIALILGYRTRWATFITWIFLISLHNRNPLLQHGGDAFLRIQLFWAIFIPWGNHWSVDSKAATSRKPIPLLITSIATTAFLLQFFYLYEFTGLLKLQSADWESGTAVLYALNQDCYVSTLGAHLQTHPQLLTFATYGTLIFELIGPFLLLAPSTLPKIRIAILLSLIALHLGFFLLMEIGFFPWFCIALLLGLLPSLFWNRALKLPIDSTKRNPLKIFHHHPITKYALLFLMLYALLSNIDALFKRPHLIPPLLHLPLDRTLKMKQSWKMFVNPAKTENWYQIIATLADESQVELFTNEIDPKIQMKISNSGLFYSHRWRKFLKEVDTTQRRALFPHVANTLATSWEKLNPQASPIKSIEILQHKKKTFKDGQRTKDEPQIIYQIQY